MRRIAQCKTITFNIQGVTSFSNFCNEKTCPEHIFESIEGNQMKIDTSIENHQKKCRNARTINLSPLFMVLFPFLSPDQKVWGI